MRNKFASHITKLAEKQKNIFLLSGDIGNRMFDDYKKVAPERFINCGIAESNMMSVAAGLGLCDFRPFVYTITPFTTLRCLEQIRVGVGYHNSPVIIVGTGSGLSYAELGPTHHSLEDIGILKTIPNINIFAPSDGFELLNFIDLALQSNYPSYIRIGKKGEPDLYSDRLEHNPNKLNWIRKGGNIAVLSYGPIINEAIIAADELISMDKKISVISFSNIKPFRTNLLKELLDMKIKHLIILEEHYSSSGLFNIISSYIAKQKLSFLSVNPLGIPDEFINTLGTQKFIRSEYKIDSKAVVEAVMNL